MFETIKEFFSRVHTVKIYALIGKSGTGKSYHSQMVAAKYHINLIIDDGLLIKGSKLIAGRSAKKEDNFIVAMKCALFRDPEHQSQVIKALQNQKYSKLLIIGTSEKMVKVIAQRLHLPEPEVIINITDIASEEEIETALKIRYTEGKHVIPVPAIEVTRSAPSIVYDTINVFFKRFKTTSFEKTIVKPGFSVPEKAVLSKNVFMQMVNQCLYDYDPLIKIVNLDVQYQNSKYYLQISLRSPQVIETSSLNELQEYIADQLEKYSSIQIESCKVSIEQWSVSSVPEILDQRREEIEQITHINIHE